MIFSNGPNLIHAMFTIGLCTGLREGDVATLRWDEIDGYGENLNPDDILCREIAFQMQIARNIAGYHGWQ